MRMKGLLVLFVAIVGLTAKCVAQLPFEVEKPKFQKFVKVTASNVNLRQQPSATSPRLVFQSNLSDDCLDCDPSLVFSNKPLRRGDEPARASILGVIGESGDWYKVYFYYSLASDTYYSEEAYIMKKYCADVQCRPLTLPVPEEMYGMDVVQINSGKYKGLCLLRDYGYYDVPLLRIGRYSNGMFIFPYYIEYSTYDECDETEFEVEDDEPSICLNNTFFIDYQLNLQKLVSDSQTIDLLMNNIEKFNKWETIYYYGIVGDFEWHEIQYTNSTR